MAFGVYLHIPYCLQRCHYCDFTTFEASQLDPIQSYVENLRQEIRFRASGVPYKRLDTVYFGGGTPSLLSPEQLASLLQELRDSGFHFQADTEITIEINPATVELEKLDGFLRSGVNRFSVGAQTFDSRLLQACGRLHSAQDTRDTLNLLKTNQANYSFDLLFALPKQSLDDLRRDLGEIANFSPPHLSAYCLTVPEGHPMSFSRPPEFEQVEMFGLIEQHLGAINLQRYEISNFAKPGFESKHNLLYWTDEPYWGVGLSSHSYFKAGAFGVRFWNPKDFKSYNAQILSLPGKGQWAFEVLPSSQIEDLSAHESLTDYCHMHLRTSQGIAIDRLRQKYPGAFTVAMERLSDLLGRGLISLSERHASLTEQGRLLSNRVFLDLTFSALEIGTVRSLDSALTFG